MRAHVLRLGTHGFGGRGRGRAFGRGFCAVESVWSSLERYNALEPHNLLVLEVREEILRTQVNNKRCDGPWLVKGIVNEKTTYSEEKSRESCD